MEDILRKIAELQAEKTRIEKLLAKKEKAVAKKTGEKKNAPKKEKEKHPGDSFVVSITEDGKTRNHSFRTHGEARGFAHRSLLKAEEITVSIEAFFTSHKMVWVNGNLQMVLGETISKGTSMVSIEEAKRFELIEKESLIRKGLLNQFSSAAKVKEEEFAPGKDPGVEIKKIPAEKVKNQKPWMRNAQEYRAWDKSRTAQGLKLAKSS